VSTTRTRSVGEEQEEQLRQAIRDADRAPLPGARHLPVLTGLKPRGGFVASQENVLVRAAQLLQESGRVYVYGETIRLETPSLGGNGLWLAPLRSGLVVETGAEDLLANVFTCQHGDDQFAVPKWFADVLLRAEPLPTILPRVVLYATRPVFDQEFVLRGPGWYPEVGILVHGPHIEPVTYVAADPSKPALGRLPSHLRTLLGGFCFRADADVGNTVGMMLTGLLMGHFLEPGKPIGLVDGNQPGLGKTLLVRVIGIVLDGVDPRVIHYTQDDEELQKRLCATLRGGNQSVLLLDNAKVRGGSVVNSPTIEAYSMAPEVSLRILGTSQNFRRPNDVLWFLTMNDTRTSPDLVSRGLPIQMQYEGRPEERRFTGPDPIVYAREHRLEILGELAGMVVAWNQQGRRPGSHEHRLHEWAGTIGGILDAAGLPEFLTNAGHAAANFNTELEELSTLAEAVIEHNGPYVDREHPEHGG
jgi:hypothetical protein